MSAPAYLDYAAWKGWTSDKFLKTSPREAAYFAGEFDFFDFDRAKVLEVGFGNGLFLGWARSRNAEVYGTELLDPSLEAARQANIPVLDSDLLKNVPGHASSFDLIVAFDVLEHLTIDQLSELLDSLPMLLKPGGFFLARFPNGQSPLGRVWQHGDHTHRQTLSASIMSQLIVGKQLVAYRMADEFRELHGSPLRRIVDYVRHRMQDATSMAIQRIFEFRAPLALNVVVVLQREAG